LDLDPAAEDACERPVGGGRQEMAVAGGETQSRVPVHGLARE
jgi:hypothetical protein